MHGFRPAVSRSSSLVWENFAPRQARDKVLVAKTLEAGGVGLFSRAENTQVVDFTKRHKRQNRHLSQSWAHFWAHFF
jgi:hypothetical protein